MKTLWRNLSGYYLRLTLQQKLLVTFFVIATIPAIVVGSFFATNLYDMILADTIREEQLAISAATPAIEASVDNIMTATDQLLTTTSHNGLFLQPMQSQRLQQDMDDWNQAVAEVESLSMVNAVRFYVGLPVDDEFFTIFSQCTAVDHIYSTYWKGIFAGDSSIKHLLCPAFYLSYDEVSQYGDLAYITKTYIYVDGVRVDCYMATYFSSAQINANLHACLSSDTAMAYIINSRNAMVTTTDPALSGTYFLSYETVEESFMSSNNFVEKEVLGEEIYAGFYSIMDTDWYLVVTLPAAPIEQASFNMAAGFIAIYLGCIALALCIATALSRNITGRLSRISHQMAQARNAPPVALPPSDCNDELDELIDTYNYMTRVICQLLEEQVQTAEEVRRAEFDSLQAQINPHFLYNTMDMIAWLSMAGKSDQVVEAVHDLSRFYKLTLSRQMSMNTLEDELEHVEIYTRLQNRRFENRITFMADIPDALMDTMIPKLTFQPIVENAILHGLLEHPRKGGTIVLTGWQEGGALVLQIADDGVGIPAEKLPHLLTNRAPSTGNGSGVAVYNTHRRLKILYGKGYGLRFESQESVGTMVEIRIPT